MKKKSTLVLSLVVMLITNSCRKDEEATVCSPDAKTVRQIVNKQATITLTATAVYPIYFTEQGTIDTKLVPCNLPQEFYQGGLQVTISGDVKATPPQPNSPCCIENFVITKITR